MKAKAHFEKQDSGLYLPVGEMHLGDIERGSVGRFTPVQSITGFVSVFFDFFNEGGTNNLIPGRPTTQTLTIPNPGNDGFFVTLRGVNAAFVTEAGGALTQRPLGEVKAWLSVPGVNQVACKIMLSDENGDDAIRVQVSGWAIMFR